MTQVGYFQVISGTKRLNLGGCRDPTAARRSAAAAASAAASGSLSSSPSPSQFPFPSWISFSCSSVSSFASAVMKGRNLKL